MRNKYVIIIGIVILVVVLGAVYRLFLLPKASAPVDTGTVREVTITARKNEWRFIPETVEVDRGDTVKLTLVNEDSYDHGIGIDGFGVSQRMPALSTINVEFVATQAGDFPFYCSVPCGEGKVEGKKRGHFDMVGKMRVRDMILETK